MASGFLLLAAAATTVSFGPVTPLTGQESSGGTPYYLYLRAGHASPTYAYAVYSVGTLAVGLGVVADWRNTYREFAAGAGVNLYAKNGSGMTVMGAFADASDSRYLEVWVFPTVVRKRLTLTGYGGVYIPAESVGVWQYYLDPLAVFWRVGGPLAVGAAYSGYKIQGLTARHGMGPAVQVAIPRGSVIVEVLRELKEFDNDVRVTLQFVF